MSDTQNEPMQDSNNASNSDRLAGIIGQVKADISLNHDGDTRVLLEQRLHDAGIELSPAEFELTLAEVSD
ncbi:hypothetical protein [Conyzicola sp.]|uniref:hypothetical protein n=1 Tax=Conyzicola sp. TaxID=1969404 RepID=UPI003988C6FB